MSCRAHAFVVASNNAQGWWRIPGTDPVFASVEIPRRMEVGRPKGEAVAIGRGIDRCEAHVRRTTSASAAAWRSLARQEQTSPPMKSMVVAGIRPNQRNATRTISIQLHP